MSWAVESTLLPKPGDTVAGKYVIQRVIGSGGMSVVFGATHNLTHKRVAIKWLVAEPGVSSEDAARRFMREARLAGHFQHPNVAQIYDFGESDGSFYMVMEWLDGESLAARLERDRRLTFAQTCAYLIPCMRAMQRAHKAGIIHRDLKPANIFLCSAATDKPEHAKVLDFGISKLMTPQAQLGSFVTKSGMVIGTPHYLSPEQLRARAIDARTDIYGFGVILYQTLSGELPFPADNFGDLAVQIATGAPRPLGALVPGLPAGVAELVTRAMAREPADRYQDMSELIAALEELARRASLPPEVQRQLDLSHWPNAPTAAAAPTPVPSSSQLRAAAIPRTRWPLLVVAGALLLAGAALVVHLYADRSTGVALKTETQPAATDPAKASGASDRTQTPEPMAAVAAEPELPRAAEAPAASEPVRTPLVAAPTRPTGPAAAQPVPAASTARPRAPGARAPEPNTPTPPKPSAAPAPEAIPAPEHNPLHMTIQ